jgi:hypothetical protein
MLFFFELFLFVLVMMTLALGEFVSRLLALIVWGAATALVVLGYLLARHSLRDVLRGAVPADDTTAPDADRPPAEPPSPAITALDEKWARTLLYNWRRTNVLLLLGACAVAGWYWLAG